MKKPPTELLYCNCAGCHKELLGDSFRGWYHQQTQAKQEKLAPPVAGRIHGRPYCSLCLKSLYPSEGKSGRKEDDSPWQQNAIRDMEDAE